MPRTCDRCASANRNPNAAQNIPKSETRTAARNQWPTQAENRTLNTSNLRRKQRLNPTQISTRERQSDVTRCWERHFDSWLRVARSLKLSTAERQCVDHPRLVPRLGYTLYCSAGCFFSAWLRRSSSMAEALHTRANSIASRPRQSLIVVSAPRSNKKLTALSSPLAIAM